MACGDRLHYKFVVMDNKTVITRSFNWSPSSAYTNDETLLVIDSPKLAAHFHARDEPKVACAELGITAHMHRKLERQRA